MSTIPYGNPQDEEPTRGRLDAFNRAFHALGPKKIASVHHKSLQSSSFISYVRVLVRYGSDFESQQLHLRINGSGEVPFASSFDCVLDNLNNKIDAAAYPKVTLLDTLHIK